MRLRLRLGQGERGSVAAGREQRGEDDQRKQGAHGVWRSDGQILAQDFVGLCQRQNPNRMPYSAQAAGNIRGKISLSSFLGEM